MLKESEVKLEEIYKLIDSIQVSGITNIQILSAMALRVEQIVKAEREAISITQTEEEKK